MSGANRSLKDLLIGVLAVLVVVALLGGIALGGHRESLPGFLKPLAGGDKHTQLVDETLGIINDDYYRTVQDKPLVNRGLQALVASLHDQFSAYYDPADYAKFQREASGEFSGVGTAVTRDRRGLRIGKVYAGSPAQKAGIRAGDVIVAVNGQRLAGRSSEAASRLIRGPAGTQVTLSLTRGRRRFDRRITRAQVAIPTVESRTLNVHGRKLGYVSLLQFSSGAHAKVGKAVRDQLKAGAKGIVFDLRHNPGGLLDEGVLVTSVFIPNGVIVSTKGRNRPRHVYDAEGPSLAPRIPLVVVVDRGSASAAEIFTGAVQDRHRGKVVGTRTYGKGVFQEIRNLSNGGALKITVGEYFTPNGRNLGGGGVREGAGLKPDINVADNPRRKGDEALAVATRTLAAEVK